MTTIWNTSFSTADALLLLVNVTPRQLQAWSEQGFLAVTVKGHKRTFPFTAMLQAAIVSHLLQRGLSTQACKRANWTELIDLIHAHYRSNTYLCASTEFIQFCPSANDAIAVLSETRSPCFVVRVRPILEWLASGVSTVRELRYATTEVAA